MIWNFFNPIKKKLESEKKQILLHLIRQKIQFIQQKPFLQINREKTFLLLKKQDTENLTKKNNGEKNRDCFNHSIQIQILISRKTFPDYVTSDATIQ